MYNTMYPSGQFPAEQVTVDNLLMLNDFMRGIMSGQWWAVKFTLEWVGDRYVVTRSRLYEESTSVARRDLRERLWGPALSPRVPPSGFRQGGDTV